MTFAVGALVQARGREWVVLPESTHDLLVLRPLGGTDDEMTGIYRPLETVETAHFKPPDPRQPGDYRSSRMLRDAVRLGFRSSAGPFRSFARLGVEPRPYQLVPLLMALKLDPVRLLIADDVGIGKTIEAALVARELLDRGEVQRMAVLCPPQLAEQWQAELRDKFHIDAELVLSSTASRLDKTTPIDKSIFEVYPYTVVSTDFIKTNRRRADFLRACPELVIVDEAHTCAYSGEGRGGRHQRHQLVAGLAANPNRHMIFVTATPHSGNEVAFRSLIAFLDPKFKEMPDDLTIKQNEAYRHQLARHFLQRRRGNIRNYLDTITPFPEREESETGYKLSTEYLHLLDKVLAYARETVQDRQGGQFHQRVRWWSALGLLRSIASSPAAAAATLRSRAASADTETVQEADAVGRSRVFDYMEDEVAEGVDITPGSDYGPSGDSRNRRRLLEMAREAESLQGDSDNKLQKGVEMVRALIKDGFQPIVFCRFIPTAEYVAQALREGLPKNVEVSSITGLLPPAEREARVLELASKPQRVLVCTDCLSEGINLQGYFDAVFHYDLSWNPTRHEQREGRVDRFGQSSKKVRVITYYGLDNRIDGIVLDVLIKKHKMIRSKLGISVPVPIDTDLLVEAIFDGLLTREKAGSVQSYLPAFEEFLKPKEEDLFGKWDASAEREYRSQSLFAQESMKVDDVARELQQVQQAIGSGVEVAGFTMDALREHGAIVSASTNGANALVHFDLTNIPQALKDAVGNFVRFKARFDLPVHDGELYLTRTHPIVEGLASYVMDAALDPEEQSIARRCGVISTDGVGIRTTLLLLRLRYHIITQHGGEARPLLAEDCQLAAFTGSPQNAGWLSQEEAEQLLSLIPSGNVPPDRARTFLDRVLDGLSEIQPYLNNLAEQRGQQLLAAHQRVRTTARLRGVSHRVVAQLPADVLGIYVYLPRG